MSRAPIRCGGISIPRRAPAIFAGLDHYVTPSWYATKRETGKVVPTWNYEAVHVYGRLRAIEDANWIRALLRDLTAHREATRPAPWALADAPADPSTRN